MKRFALPQTDGISIICAVSSSQFISGHNNGAIRLWNLYDQNVYIGPPNFLVEINSNRVENKKILELVPFPIKNRFIVYYESNEMEIWDLQMCQCVKRLQLWGIYNFNCLVPLPGNLIAIGLDCFQAWGCFNVYCLENGEQLFANKSDTHRPHGILMAAVKGYLAFHPCCHANLSIWKVGLQICEMTSECESDRIYSMASTPEGFLITGGHAIQTFKVDEDGHGQLFHKIDNNNVIDVIMPLQAFSMAIVDRRQRRDCVWLRNTLVDRISHYVGDSFIAQGEFYPATSVGHINLPGTGTILSIYNGLEICLHQDAKLNQIVPKEIAELRLVARIVGQSLRTKSGLFWRLNLPLLLTIIGHSVLPSDNLPMKTVENIIETYLGRPILLATNYGFWNSLEDFNRFAVDG